MAEQKKIPAELLKLVKRPEVKDGKPVTRKGKDGDEVVLRALDAAEVLDWAVTEDDRLVVVTVDGQKCSADAPDGTYAKLNPPAQA